MLGIAQLSCWVEKYPSQSLELAESTVIVLGFDCGSGHDGCNVGEHVAHGSVEDETVDWLMERLGAEKGDGNERASCQR